MTEDDTVASEKEATLGRPVDAWTVLQRISGLLLLPLLALHVWDRLLAHDPATLGRVFLANRWRSTPWQLAEFALLLIGTVHGVQGVMWQIRRHLRSPKLQLAVEAVLLAVTVPLALYALWVVVAAPHTW
jgi:succinate dehydrogenase hydrophobic anchor subunit